MKNWYEKSENYYRLQAEAGIKENIVTGILAALLALLSGSTIYQAAQRGNVSEEDVVDALQNKQMVEQARDVMEKDRMSMENPIESVELNLNDLKQFITKHEGKESKVYIDTEGNPTIGIGFNLNNPQAINILQEMNLNYSDIIMGKQTLNDQQINQIFDISLNTAMEDARKFAGDFDTLPYEAKVVIVDMAFNLGYHRLSEFKNMKANLDKHNFQEAAKEMENSKWYNQVKSRGRELVSIMYSIKN